MERDSSPGQCAEPPPETPDPEAVDAEIDRLVDANRVQCLWSAPKRYYPKSDEARLSVLDTIQRYGNRDAFIRAGRLKQWLL